MRRRRGQESGFALLLVFVMAAAIAISLYMQLPRAAFEAQRNKEQLLIERGEQYTRAIQLFVTQRKRYPATLEELENTNNVRYLRRRYKDPLTGKDEWRLVHVNGMGVLTDSKVKKLDEKKDQSVNTFITEGPAIGSTGPANGNNAASAAMRKRPSDQNPVPGSGPANFDPNNVNPAGAPPFGGQPPQPGQPMVQGQLGQPPVQQGQPVNPNQPQSYPPYPGQVQPGFQPGVQPGIQPGVQPGVQQGFQQPPPGGLPLPGTPGFQPGAGQPTYPTNAAVQPGREPGAGAIAAQGNPATNLINDLLTKPRPGGMAGLPGMPTGQQIGGGIAGVASTAEGSGIKVYNDRDKYEEWEFIYDPKKDKRLTGMVQTGSGQLGQQGQGGQGGLPGQGVNPGFNPFGGQPVSPGNQTPQQPGGQGFPGGGRQPIRRN